MSEMEDNDKWLVVLIDKKKSRSAQILMLPEN